MDNKLVSKLESMKVPDANAYWISPTGQLFEVESKHIDEIIKSPESFSLTKEYVDEVYKKHNEPRGFEGKARHEIMDSLIRSGWIRVRYYAKNDCYSVELNSLTKKVKDYLWAWASGIVEANSKRKLSDVKIIEFLTKNTLMLNIDRITKDELCRSSTISAEIDANKSFDELFFEGLDLLVKGYKEFAEGLSDIADNHIKKRDKEAK